MTIRAVTFNAAGTLIAPFPSVGAVYAELAQAHGLDRSTVELQAVFGPAFRVVQQRWGVPYGADDEDARRMQTKKGRNVLVASMSPTEVSMGEKQALQFSAH